MNGQKVVKVFCHEPAVKADFDVVNAALCKDMEKAHTFSNLFGPIMNNVGNILYVATAFVGGLIITNGWNNFSVQNLAAGSFAAPLAISVVASYLGMSKQFMGQVNQASQQINAIAMAMAGADRIFTLIDSEPEEDKGYVTLVNCTEEDGVITECAEHTGHWAWKHPHATGAPSPIRPCGATWCWITWISPTCRRSRCCTISPFTPSRARRWPSWAPPARARPPSPT